MSLLRHRWLSCLGRFVLLLQRPLSYMTFQSFGFERSCLRLFKKHAHLIWYLRLSTYMTHICLWNYIMFVKMGFGYWCATSLSAFFSYIVTTRGENSYWPVNPTAIGRFVESVTFELKIELLTNISGDRFVIRSKWSEPVGHLDSPLIKTHAFVTQYGHMRNVHIYGSTYLGSNS